MTTPTCTPVAYPSSALPPKHMRHAGRSPKAGRAGCLDLLGSPELFDAPGLLDELGGENIELPAALTALIRDVPLPADSKCDDLSRIGATSSPPPQPQGLEPVDASTSPSIPLNVIESAIASTDSATIARDGPAATEVPAVSPVPPTASAVGDLGAELADALGPQLA